MLIRPDFMSATQGNTEQNTASKNHTHTQSPIDCNDILW